MRLQDTYITIQPKLAETLGIRNTLALPRLIKISINIGMGSLQGNESLQKTIGENLQLITGQKPVLTRSKKAIAGFKIREGDAIGYKVTLRKQRMYDFLDRLITYVFPRLRDFQGLSLTGFDGHGNYTFGLKEQTVFPEVPFTNNETTHGLEVSIITTAHNREATKALLENLGFPFAEPKEGK